MSLPSHTRRLRGTDIMLAVLRNRDYSLLWFGQLVSVFGDWLLTIALPFAVYDLTGSTLATGAMFLAQTLPRVVLASFAGVLVDRWDRRRTMIAADLFRGCALLALFLVHSSGAVPVIYLVALANSAVGQLFLPAKNALIPRIVTGEQLTAANALSSLSDNMTRLIAPALGGVVYGLYGLPFAVGIDAASFAVSALCLAFVAPHLHARTPGEAVMPFSPGIAWREWRAGLRFARGHAVALAVFAGVGITNIAEGIYSVSFVPFTRQVLGGGAATLGLIVSAQAIGGILGSVLFGRFGDRLPVALTVGLSNAVDGLLLLAIFNLSGRVPVPPVAFAAGCMAIAGAAVIGFFVFQDALLQRSVPDAYRGRVFGAYATVRAAAMLCGQGAAGLFADRIGIVPIMSLGGVTELIAGAVAFMLLRRAIAETATREPVKGPEVTAAHTPPHPSS